MDETLLALETEFELLLTKSMEAAQDSEIEAIGLQLETLEAEICNTPAHSPLGLRVKVRRLMYDLGEERPKHDLNCFQSIGRDLDRLEAIWPAEERQASD